MGISMTPDQYFDSFVLGNYNDFIARPDCIRRGFNAAIAASHMADHYFKYYKRNDPTKVSKFSEIRDYLNYISQKKCGHFRDIRSIANAYKHLYTRGNSQTTIDSAGRIELIQIKGEDVSEVSFEPLEVNSKSVVIFTKKTGEQIELRTAFESVVDFWRKEIYSL
jgi:hypothetical protein